MSDGVIEKYLPSEDNYSEEEVKVVDNGVYKAIKIEMNKPGATYINLNAMFHGKVGDFGSKTNIPCTFTSWDMPLNTQTYDLKIAGEYPSNKPFYVFPNKATSGNAIYDLEFPTGFFSEQGRYRFNFILENENTRITSKDCYFDVEQSMINVAIDFPDGIDMFDNEYLKWRSEVEEQISKIADLIKQYEKTLDDNKEISQSYLNHVQQAIDNAISNLGKLNSENTWTGKQHFNGGLTASTVGGNMLQGDNLKIDSSASLPQNTTVAVPALKYVSNKLGNGVFAFEQKIDVNTETSKNNTKATFVNGVGTATGGNHYMSIRVFRYQDCYDNGTWSIVEIHANCNIPDSAKGKPIIQFGDDTHLFEGIDQTPFTLGNWILMFDKNSKTLVANGKINSSGTNDCQDATMV